MLWKCKVKGCDYMAPPTVKGYRSITGHQLSHSVKGVPKAERGFCLVDEGTGEVVAKTIAEAKEKGLLEEEKVIKEELEGEEELEEEEETEEEGEEEEKPKKQKEITRPQVSSEGIFRYTINLPADAFALFNIAVAHGLEKDGNKVFDEWVWDCIRARFEHDYRMQLVLAPIGEEQHG